MTNPTGDAPRHAVVERLDASIERNVALDVASMSPEMRERYRAALSLPTGDALKASAAQDFKARCAEVLEWKKTGILTGDALRRKASEIRERLNGCFDMGQALHMAEQETAREAMEAALSVEQAPQPVATETQPIGLMDVNGLEALVDEVRSRPTPTEAPPVESQAAEIRAKALEEAAKIADEEGALWGYMEGSSARVVGARIRRAGLAVEGSAE